MNTTPNHIVSSMLQIQYVSDLHIEEWPEGTPFLTFVTPVAPILVIAGDICSVWNPLYKQFLAWTSRNWFCVIFTAGNHEYHNNDDSKHSIHEADIFMHRLTEEYPNLHYLNYGHSYTIPGTNLRFVGATLWANVDPAIHEYVTNEIKKKDFRRIYAQNAAFTPAEMTLHHTFHTRFLEQALTPRAKETLIVITHYLPTFELLEPEYKDDIIRTCYASADDFLFTPNITAWICGHGHRATSYKSPTCTVYMNARGYNKEKEIERTVDKYNPKMVLNINSK